MASSSTIYTIDAGDVGKVVYDLTFVGATANPPGYLDTDHIFMWLNDVQVTVGGGSEAYGGSGITFVFTTPTQVTVTGYAGILNDKVEFRRTMPIDKPIVDFVDGAGLTESDLDNLALENLYRVHEIQDGFGTGTQNYYELAKLYANAGEDVAVEAGQYSAKHFSIKASDHADAAAASETAAGLSEDAAAASETAAGLSQTSAQESAGTAISAALQSIGAKDDAETAQTEAESAQTAAELAQTNAEAAQAAAELAETGAETAKDDAVLAETGAETAQESAELAEANAEASELAAADSEEAAALSEAAAAASEDLAEEWAENPEDTAITGSPGSYSALHWAAKAEAAAASGLYKESEHTATAGQTVFTHTSDVVNEQISINGAIIAAADYTVSDTNEITLAAGTAAGDIVRIQTIGLIAVNEYVALSGNTSEPMTGQLRLAGGPVDDDDAANKAYVDSAAGGNLLINGNFWIWQRDTSQTSAGYGSDDRWRNMNYGTSKTHSMQTFTPGQTDVPGNPAYYSRTVVSSVAGAGNYCLKSQRIENLYASSGKTMTLSFWAKADAAKNIAVCGVQLFGSGGSDSVLDISPTTLALNTTWAKYTVPINFPSITGKTIGTSPSYGVAFWFDAGADYSDRASGVGQQSGTFDIAQVKLEEGPVATPFVNRPIAEELALCQRYYQENQVFFSGMTNSGSIYYATSSFLQPMRVNPTLVLGSLHTSGFDLASMTVNASLPGFIQTACIASTTSNGAYYYATYKATAEL